MEGHCQEDRQKAPASQARPHKNTVEVEGKMSAFVFSDENKVSMNGPLMGWEEDDPCRYAHQSCKGKIFGALKRCRDRREKSQALCKAAEREKEEDKELTQQIQELQQVSQASIVGAKDVQQSASMVMLAVGGTVLVGGVLFLVARKSKKSKKKKNSTKSED